MLRRRTIGRKKVLIEVVEELTSSGTFIVPSGCTSIDAFVVGAGGGGGSGGSYYPGAGGGAGYTKVYYGISVTPGQKLTVKIGQGKSNNSLDSKVGYMVQGIQRLKKLMEEMAAQVVAHLINRGELMEEMVVLIILT